MTVTDFPTEFPDANEMVIDSLDDMQPFPRAGKFFAERIYQEEVKKGGIVLKQGDRPREGMEEVVDVRTKRARVEQLGPARDGQPWDFDAGCDVIVPYHAGEKFEWTNQRGITESIWIIDVNEVVAIFKPRFNPDKTSALSV